MIDLCVGIDYSGAEAPTSRLKGLQVFSARPKEMCEKWLGPAVSNNGKPLNWTRAEIAQMLLEQARQGVRFLAGIDHGFSFPSSDFKRYCLKSWPEFMADFVHHWPTDGDHVPSISSAMACFMGTRTRRRPASASARQANSDCVSAGWRKWTLAAFCRVTLSRHSPTSNWRKAGAKAGFLE
ncbi:MAG: hypothetical protein IPK39_13015 [Sulfuritalea sp.]|nr:hypothetical protein [Sulfuritalea sp.]